MFSYSALHLLLMHLYWDLLHQVLGISKLLLLLTHLIGLPVSKCDKLEENLILVNMCLCHAYESCWFIQIFIDLHTISTFFFFLGGRGGSKYVHLLNPGYYLRMPTWPIRWTIIQPLFLAGLQKHFCFYLDCWCPSLFLGCWRWVVVVLSVNYPFPDGDYA